MRYLSVCSGIEAATQAWHPLGWTPAAFSEIEPFPSAVLAHHYPHVPNLGDMTKFRDWKHDAIDLLVGGTPCQSFSVAGLRKGMADPRGNLALTYLAIAERNRPRWVVWENVPGVLSSNGGRDFGSFLGGLGQLGYGFAYRVLDAQFCRTRRFPWAVPQRRRRVFVVGYLGDWRRAAAVLFDRESVSGGAKPRRETGGEVAQCLTTGTGQRYDPETETLPVAFPWQMGGSINMPIDTDGSVGTLVKNQIMAMQQGPMVRRLTPVECERLQGFPDDFTRIPYRGKPDHLCPDGPRYKALGNSMAVNVMDYIGQRIALVDAMTTAELEAA